tara:strand:+ start:3235 stop:4473 length:1239 start_codon:yes stop_codon:yes gene_type:complete
MGVIRVLHEASKLGWSMTDPTWINLGQGQPEPGELEGAPPRLSAITLDPTDHAYGPLEGLPELRARIAEDYNRRFRVGKASQYGPENVAIAPGGRQALTRTAASLGETVLGYQLPDYTAYEEMIAAHLDRLTPVALRGEESAGFLVPAERVAEAMTEQGVSAYLLSNPVNPTGSSMRGDDLARLVALSQTRGLTLLSDEFYSHFVYDVDANGVATPGKGPVSAAAFVDDVEEDPVLIFDGLTKNHRYPGWRIGWVVGPSHLVEATARTASSLDGGPSRPSQRFAMAALEPDRADDETTNLRVRFCEKRNLMIERLTEMGVRFPGVSDSTFYCWGDLSGLPAGMNDGMSFFRKALERKVITVPGEFFDVDPGHRRPGPSPYRNFMRFSFGPPIQDVRRGLGLLAEMVGTPAKV